MCKVSHACSTVGPMVLDGSFGKDFEIKTFKYVSAVIAAVNNMDKLDEAVQSKSKALFLLTGTIFNLQSSIEKIHHADKKVYVDVDLMEGFGKDAVFLEYLHKVLKPDGIITTKGSLIKKAKTMDLFAIQRIFVFDSMSLSSGIDSVLKIKPDAVEILPGVMPKVIKKVKDKTEMPVICGGLILDQDDVDIAIDAGAIAITTSNTSLWNLG